MRRMHASIHINLCIPATKLEPRLENSSMADPNSACAISMKATINITRIMMKLLMSVAISARVSVSCGGIHSQKIAKSWHKKAKYCV